MNWKYFGFVYGISFVLAPVLVISKRLFHMPTWLVWMVAVACGVGLGALSRKYFPYERTK